MVAEVGEAVGLWKYVSVLLHVLFIAVADIKGKHSHGISTHFGHCDSESSGLQFCKRHA